MGARGPKPKHPALKVAPGTRPVEGRVAGRVRRGLPVCPRELTGEAAAEWAHLAAELDDAGTLAVVDRGILAAYCLAVADMLAARAAINREGRILKVAQQTSKGDVIGHKFSEHPACKMLERASMRVDKFGRALGLNPEARSRQEAGQPAAAKAGNKVVAIRDRIQAARNGG